ncbi:MAG: helicase-related protein, partial [Halobacteriovoraceae bacterium]|nr:helicase-related protein [Halobacteriovoraceae bacterium]
DRDELLRNLVTIQYERNDYDFSRGCFRVRGDIVDIFPSHEDSQMIRLTFFGDALESISVMDPLRGKFLYSLNKITIYPKSHYVVSEEKMKRAIKSVRRELKVRINEFQGQGKLVERQRIEQRTLLDLEMLEEMGFCTGIENYSRHLTGTAPGDPPPTLIDFFGNDFLTIIDESHMTIPQTGGMYRGDRARKLNLVEYGFRLASALDNRPLNFSEFEEKLDKVLYVSATPGNYEMEKTGGEYVEQIIRPTGLLDPLVEVRSAKEQVDDMLVECRKTIQNNGRILITTLTKKLAEELTSYYQTLGMKIRYLHSDIVTIERMEIIRGLRLGEFDILVGINLLREGLDLPEVSLVGILDADKEGFLRSERSLIQTIGRAARNAEGRVLLYAYKTTDSMNKAVSETDRRRKIQEEHNKKQGIIPKSIDKKVSGGIIETLRGNKSGKSSKREAINREFTSENLDREIKRLKELMKQSSRELRFEDAIKYRNKIKELSEARFLL